MLVAFIWVAVGTLLVQSSFALYFVFTMVRNGRSRTIQYAPKAAIVLCLRGADPFLRECISRLLEQDYDDYELHVVVDSRRDNSNAIVDEFRSNPRLQVQVLFEPATSCSLKCSSLVQAVRGLDLSFQVVAFCDADAAPTRTWLADLVAPLRQENVAVSTGNRWYRPAGDNGAAVVRFLWNVPVAVNMLVFHIAWGGSLAIRRSTIDDLRLLDHWSNALCEDTMLYGVLKKHSLRQVFVPSVMMVNQERCSFRELMNWVPRQLLTTKLYHPSWPANVGYGVISSGVVCLFAIMSTIGLSRSEFSEVANLGLVFVLFQIANALLVLVCDWSVRWRMASPEPGCMPVLSFGSILQLPVWITVGQILSPLWFLKCFCMSKVVWRGIEYRIANQVIVRGEYKEFAPRKGNQQSL